jgi:serine/threonine-protein phosphatase 2A regulatory subunit B''
MIDVHDLLKYEDCSLTYTMCNRVANGYARKLFSGEPGKMSYEDFVVFLISEVDKTSKTAISYWFNALDLDYDGYITKYEIQHFFAEQQERLQSLSQGDVLFEDILCQLLDIVQKGNPQFSSTGEDLSCSISRQDLLDCKNAPIFLNTLFNLNQLLIAEQRDPQRQAQILSTPQLSPWDRYAISGYIMLAEIDDEEDEYIDDEDLLGGEVGLEAWEQSVRDMQQSQNFAVGSA